MSGENIKISEELNLDDLDQVAGGYIYDTGSEAQVIDRKGDVVNSFPYDINVNGSRMNTRQQAIQDSRQRGLSDLVLYYNELMDLRDMHR